MDHTGGWAESASRRGKVRRSPLLMIDADREQIESDDSGSGVPWGVE